MDSSNKVIHDLLLEVKPETAVHAKDACPYCTPAAAQAASGQNPDSTGGGAPDVTTITQEDLDNAVKAATAPLQQELDELRNFKAEVESTDAVRALQEQVEAKEAEKADLQQKLDAANVEINETKSQHDDLVAWLNAEASKAEQEAAIAALRDERSQKVRELEIFDETYIEENAQRFAEMDEEAFEAALVDWKTAKEAAKASKGKTGETPDPTKTQTAFTATRDDDGIVPKSQLSGVMGLRNAGVDVRGIR